MGAYDMVLVELPTRILASSSDDGSGVGFLFFLVGPVVGFAIWGWIHAKYRNRNARYKPESVVAHTVQNLATDDHYESSFQKSSRYISGRNDTSPHERAQFVKVFEAEELPAEPDAGEHPPATP